jgi:hypothetical protein
MTDEAGEEMEDDEEEEDLMPEILPMHFEAAVRNDRRSVSTGTSPNTYLLPKPCNSQELL